MVCLWRGKEGRKEVRKEGFFEGGLIARRTDLCNAVEDLSDEEKKIEEAPIVAQEVYVLTRMGRTEEALARSVELDVKK